MSEIGNGDHSREAVQAEALSRFRSDIRYAGDYFNLINIFSKYMSGYLGITEDFSMKLCNEMSDRLPDAELFESDLEMAREQMQLGLVRVILPLIEQYGLPRAEYAVWLRDSIPVALGPSNGRHGSDQCAEYNMEGINDVACSVSHACPVKVVRQVLVRDSLNADFESDNYKDPWLADTIYRTQLKLDTATAKGLIDYEYAVVVKNIYIDDLRNINLVNPETK